MTIWRPHQNIRVKALGLHWRNGALLAAEVPDDSGALKGVRPLGGTVEFGETWQQTLHREFREELNIDVVICGEPQVLENIYSHEGHVGHEILFVAEVLFPEGAFAGQDVIGLSEDNGACWTARWFTPEDLEARGVALFPDGLSEHLRTGWGRSG